MNNATCSSTRSCEADENAVTQAQVTNLAAQISTQRAKLRELNDQKKLIQQKTGIKVQWPGTAAKGKLMPSFTPMEEEPSTVEFAQLYMAFTKRRPPKLQVLVGSCWLPKPITTPSHMPTQALPP